MFAGALPRTSIRPMAVLAAAFAIALALKVVNVGIGAPQIMIDDFTLYEGGFLVWFGQAPPQHAFIESWICGLCSLAVFAVKTLLAGHRLAATEGYFVSGALRDFYNAPDLYYAAYRSLLLTVDLLTAAIVFKIARRALSGTPWPAVWATTLFLFTANTLWSALVGRPDTLMAFAALAGVYLYLISITGDTPAAFWWSAICLGLAAGLKMHGAVFTVCVALDLVRRAGVRRGWRPAVSFAAVAFFFFLVSDGSLLFDPLMYVKARWATYHDDYSPYIHWGDQFLVILRTTGWVILPLTLAGAAIAWRDDEPRSPLKSLAVVAIGWLVVFALTRQLRGYWMLAAAPLLYILAARALDRLRQPWLQTAVAAGIVAVMAGQMATLSWRMQHTDLTELRTWVTANVHPGQRFYLVGDSVLRLPRDTRTMRLYQTAYEREMAADLTGGRSFVERHVKNWEERANLRLFDMLGFQNAGGFALFNYRDWPPAKFGDLAPMESMDVVIVQEGFSPDDVPGLAPLLASRFQFVAERRSEGGDGSGVRHRIYRRIAS